MIQGAFAQANPELEKLIAPDAKVEKLASGVQFGEGPLWIPRDGGFLIFSDVPANKIKRWDAKGGLADFRDVPGPNGHALDAAGNIITCEEGGRKLVSADKEGNVTVLVETFEGKLLNSPNDVVVGADGIIWFTDPPFGLRGKPREQEKNNVFRFDPKTKDLKAVVTDMNRPNGLVLSPDGKKLYIADSGPKHVRVFEIQPNGTLDAGKVFATMRVGSPDGMRCDEHGNLWVAAGGVTIFAPDGKLIGRVEVPEALSNIAFGGADYKTLYITGRTSLFSVQTKVAGAVAKKN
jgi:gluconolactonase